MSEGSPGDGLGWPVSTRTATLVGSGLTAALRGILELQPAALVIETRGPVPEAGFVARRLGSARFPVLGVVGSLTRDGPARPVGLDHPDPAEAAAAQSALAASLSPLARLRCRRLLLPIGDGGVPGAPALRNLLPTIPEPAQAVREWKEMQRPAREEAADRLIRRIDALARLEPRVRFLLLPEGDPLTLLDEEVAGWILEDLPVKNVGLVLETGVLGLLETFGGPGVSAWLQLLGERVEMVVLADHDEKERADLLPGAGVLRFSELADQLPRTVPWVIRGDPSAGEAFFRGCVDVLERALGRPPDLEGLT